MSDSDIILVTEESPVEIVVSERGDPGPPGPPGPPGSPGGGGNYSHTQAAASTEWIVPHNLGIRPSRIAVYTNDGTNILGFIQEPIDDNTLVIRYGVAISGRADIS